MCCQCYAPPSLCPSPLTCWVLSGFSTLKAPLITEAGLLPTAHHFLSVRLFCSEGGNSSVTLLLCLYTVYSMQYGINCYDNMLFIFNWCWYTSQYETSYYFVATCFRGRCVCTLQAFITWWWYRWWTLWYFPSLLAHVCNLVNSYTSPDGSASHLEVVLSVWDHLISLLAKQGSTQRSVVHQCWRRCGIQLNGTLLKWLAEH